MLQREVVERIVAAPGDSEFSRLSVMLQYRFDMEMLIDVPAESFDPAPKVESAVVRLIPLNPLPHQARDETLFAEVVSHAFSQRRKTLRNTLKGLVSGDQLAALGINAGARAQELSCCGFCADCRCPCGSGLVRRLALHELYFVAVGIFDKSDYGCAVFHLARARG